MLAAEAASRREPLATRRHMERALNFNWPYTELPRRRLGMDTPHDRRYTHTRRRRSNSRRQCSAAGRIDAEAARENCIRARKKNLNGRVKAVCGRERERESAGEAKYVCGAMKTGGSLIIGQTYGRTAF